MPTLQYCTTQNKTIFYMQLSNIVNHNECLVFRPNDFCQKRAILVKSQRNAGINSNKLVKSLSLTK